MLIRFTISLLLLALALSNLPHPSQDYNYDSVTPSATSIEAERAWSSLLESVSVRNAGKPLEEWPVIDQFHYYAAKNGLAGITAAPSTAVGCPGTPR